MAVSTLRAVLSCELQKAWETVTSLEHYAWRSDLDKIEVREDGRKFVEYTKDGYSTSFTITAFEPRRRYAFDMENDNMKGRWTGLFSTENGKTILEFTEDVQAKKLLMKPFVGAYLKKQQAAYLADLKKELE